MALSKVFTPSDRTRFARLALIIVEELTPILLDVLEKEISPRVIFNTVKANTPLFKIIRKDQLLVIQNAHTDGYRDFDITLLNTLIRNLCSNIPSPTQGWGITEMPSQGEIVGEKKSKIIKDQIEFKETIYPTYMDIASDVQNRISQLEKEYGDLSTALTKHGEDWHRKIDQLVKKLKAEVAEMKITQLKTLQKHLVEMNKNITEIKDVVNSAEIALDTQDISKLFAVKSNLDRYRKLPQEIHEDNTKTSEAGSSSPVKHLLDEPETVTTIDTGYSELYSVACLSDEGIWTSGDDNTMKLFSINQGSLLKSITTTSGTWPEDKAVTKIMDLVYTDYHDRTVNIVKNEEVIKLQNWGPDGICSTSSGDLMVIMISDDNKLLQTKVVRYSGSTEKQTIQFDDQTDPKNDCVHIIDQDEQFLHYINCGLSYPWGLCKDTNDNLFAAQWGNRQMEIPLPALDYLEGPEYMTSCDLCKTAMVQLYCDICLCKLCIEEDVASELTKPHTVVG
ncbi:uncharacterized protein LOC134237300, partial [Saccostrea cucullata]|uniref:uncharacterized protein LOC134237300 n=1 Tax=Saccostrea cuccullata TaxID=36930 RepID=UPI002ED5E110